MCRQGALQAALKLLSHRAYSVQEIRDKLAAKGYNPEEISPVIEYLLQRGYLNDAALCEFLAAKYIREEKYGRLLIVQKLKQRGFTVDTIERALQALSPCDELTTAWRLCSKRFKQREDLTLQQLARFLGNRGFTQKTIRQIWENLRGQ